MAINKGLNFFDTSDAANSDNVGAYVRSSDGTLITHETVGSNEHLHVMAALQAADGTALTETGGALDVNVSNTVTVSATDLDIRDLVNTQDSIAIGDSTDIIDVQTLDSAFDDLGKGFIMAGVRQDASGSPVSADGDAHPLVFNDDGELKVAADLTSDVADDAADSGNPVKIGGRAVDGALTALSASNDRYDLLADLYRRTWVNSAPNIGMQVSAETTVGVTAVQLAATPLGGRTRIEVQNRSGKPIFLGHSGVTTSTGIRLTNNDSWSSDFGEDIDLYAISGSAAASDLRIMEIA